MTERTERDDLADRVARVLVDRIDGFDRLVSVTRLSGGASQETYRLELEANGRPMALALRRAAGGTEDREGMTRPGLAVEALIMRRVRAAGVPAPEIVHVLEAADGLGDGFVMEWLDGETLGNRIVRAPELAPIRPRLAFECGQILARIHGIDVAQAGLDRQLETVPTERFIHEVWDQYQAFDTPQPMIDYTARWLLDRVPTVDELGLVHNDFRNGNLMVTTDGVAAVLDWELAHIGDPVRDLGWICTSSWRFGRHDLPVGGFGHREDLLDGYEEVSGRRVDPEHLRFWEVFGSFWWAVGCLRMAEAWRTGPDATVERPGIARRSSECQADCVNLVIPGPVELVEPSSPLTSTDMPNTDELLGSVSDFLRHDLRSTLEGRSRFLALVAANSLEIVRRELALAPHAMAAEHQRLRTLLGHDGDIDALRLSLTEQVRSGQVALDHPGLVDHLRTTVMNQLNIDQPSYPALAGPADDERS